MKGQCRQGIALQQMCTTVLFPRNLWKIFAKKKTHWDNIYRARGQREQRLLLEHDCLCCLLHTDTQTQGGRLTHKPGGFSPYCLLHAGLPSSASSFCPPPHPPFFQLRRRAFDVTGCYYLTQLCRAPTAPPNRQMLFYPTFEEVMRQWVKQDCDHRQKDMEALWMHLNLGLL